MTPQSGANPATPAAAPPPTTVAFVCRHGDLADGASRVVQVGHIRVAVFRRGDDYVAVRDICPHHGAPLAHGRLRGTCIPSEVGEFNYRRPGEFLRCPWHGWEFELATGRAVHDEHIRVAVYPVRRDGDDVVVDIAG
jgi:nitrite reductase/ring-hydroxylating ferredoxin subunit